MLYDIRMPNVWNNVCMPSFVHLTMNFFSLFDLFIYSLFFSYSRGTTTIDRKLFKTWLKDVNSFLVHILNFVFFSFLFFFAGRLCCMLVGFWLWGYLAMCLSACVFCDCILCLITLSLACCRSQSLTGHLSSLWNGFITNAIMAQCRAHEN